LLHVASAADEDPVGRARSAVAAALGSAERAAIAVEVALNAVENARAERDDREEDLLLVLKEWNVYKIRRARVALKEASSRAADAVEIAEKVSESAAAARLAASSARVLVDRAAEAKSLRRSISAANKAHKLARNAGTFAERAATLSQELKTRWLLPVNITGPDETEGAGESADAEPDRSP